MAGSLAALLLGSGAGVAADSRLTGEGRCRDGAANGAYELKAADGRVRVTGAFRRGRPVATFLFFDPAGVRVAAIPYEDGVKSGTVTLWYPRDAAAAEPRRRLEAAWAADERNGVSRSWHPNGNPRSERTYQRGVLVAAAAWAAGGAPLDDAAARRQADAERATEDAELAALLRLVSEHLPACSCSLPRSAGGPALRRFDADLPLG